jgi:hypothetical protein
MTMRRCLGASIAAAAAVVAVGGCGLGGLDDGAAVATDASPGDACGPIEDCANGVDDDCNGEVDCADPACATAGFACTRAAIPIGWTLVAFSQKTRPVCPTTFGTEHAIVSGVAGAADTCSCVCSGTAATCGGTAHFRQSENACTTFTEGPDLAVNDGACGSVATTLDETSEMLDDNGSNTSAQQGACSGVGMVTSAPTPTFDEGATCGQPPALGAGCTTGVCAPSTGASFEACILHAGTMACPTFGYSTQHLVSPGTPGYVDARSCGACPCATSLGCNSVSSITLFQGGGCTGGSYGMGDGCQPFSGSTAYASYRVAFSTTGSSTCQPAGASPAGGGVNLDAAVETICCGP